MTVQGQNNSVIISCKTGENSIIDLRHFVISQKGTLIQQARRRTKQRLFFIPSGDTEAHATGEGESEQIHTSQGMNKHGAGHVLRKT